MSNKKKLESKLLEPGAMFQVTDVIKDTVLPPGSRGFVTSIRGTDDSYQDVAKISAVVIRKGKGGKNRLMSMLIYVPIFFIDHKNFAKILPPENSKKAYVYARPAILSSTDIRQLESMEFIGWAVAMARRLRLMYDNSRHKKWPEQKSHPINVMRNLNDYFNDNPPEYREKYANVECRENFTEVARKMLSSMVRLQLQQDLHAVDVEINAAEFLLFTNKGEFIPKDAKDKTNEYKFTDDNAMLERTIKHYVNTRKYIKSLYDIKRPKS